VAETVWARFGANGSLLWYFEGIGPDVGFAAALGDGRTLVFNFTSMNGTLIAADGKSGTPVSPPWNGFVSAIAASPDGGVVLAGGTIDKSSDRNVARLASDLTTVWQTTFVVDADDYGNYAAPNAVTIDAQGAVYMSLGIYPYFLGRQPPYHGSTNSYYATITAFAP
jgi:hypothetical protein